MPFHLYLVVAAWGLGGGFGALLRIQAERAAQLYRDQCILTLARILSNYGIGKGRQTLKDVHHFVSGLSLGLVVFGLQKGVRYQLNSFQLLDLTANCLSATTLHLIVLSSPPTTQDLMKHAALNGPTPKIFLIFCPEFSIFWACEVRTSQALALAQPTGQNNVVGRAVAKYIQNLGLSRPKLLAHAEKGRNIAQRNKNKGEYRKPRNVSSLQERSTTLHKLNEGSCYWYHGLETLPIFLNAGADELEILHSWS